MDQFETECELCLLVGIDMKFIPVSCERGVAFGVGEGSL